MFLEGRQVIFQAALAVVNIIEPELIKLQDFNDLYIMLDSKPKELISTPDVIIKHMNKFKNVTMKYINKLREKNRPIVMDDQKTVWLDNCRAGCPNDHDTIIFKRIKLLNKFFLLNKSIRI